MKTYLDCFPCFLDQALRAARIATDDPVKIKAVLDAVALMLPRISLDSPPPEIGRFIYGTVHKITNNRDPYGQIKEKSTEEALALYPYMKALVEKSKDPLLAAIRMAIAGNIIDFGPNRKFDLKEEIDHTRGKAFAVYDYERFKIDLSRAKSVLYLGDNAGECVFDRVLLETMDKPATYVVREKPVINDATLADARKAGIDGVAELISSGTDAPGTLLETCNEAFLRLYRNAEIVISKGQGNYEALSGENRAIFFLLKVKCPVIADHLKLKVGDIVLKGENTGTL